MNVLSRGARFFYGLFLFLFYRRTLDLGELLKGKRVAIVGAADSAFHTGKGSFIDGFDFVIRINKGAMVVQKGEWINDIGRKTDILFHSFFENEKSGAGPLDFAMFDVLGVRYLVNPVAEYPGYRVMFNYYKKYLAPRVTYSLSRETYERISKPLGQYRPTIGFCALMTTMECDFAELYLTGFTFFRTPFGAGYRKELSKVVEVRKFISDQGLHNPDLELATFARKGRESKWRNINMDKSLLAILKQIEEPGDERQ
jgi:hypothetical protein